jgi:hypothetical protein
MNAHPTPHIGATLAQRRALTYQLQQRELDAERDRLERTTAALQVDALLDRIRENDACGCAECDDEPQVSPWVFWPVVVGCSGVLTFVAYELATRLLPLLWWLS